MRSSQVASNCPRESLNLERPTWLLGSSDVMNPYLVAVIAILVVDTLLDLVVDTLNCRHSDVELPDEFKGVYDAERYAKSQEYLKAHTRFDVRISVIALPLTLAFILFGGFNVVDTVARGFGLSPIWTGLLFVGILLLGGHIVQLPAAMYRTFAIEERFGFNRTTPATFTTDILKSWVLTAVIGGPIFCVIVWFFMRFEGWAWIACWGAVSAFQLVLSFLAPIFIMPLFNKYTPLGNDALRTSIEAYAQSQSFKMKGVYAMDGSRRSSKSNAFFTGFGKFRRIVLYDTLIEKHDIDELTAVVAHEMGHYKLRHILKFMLISVLTSGLMFFLLSVFIRDPRLSAAFGMQHHSVYAGLFLFGFLYSPIATILSVSSNAISRRFEFEADRFAVTTHGMREAYIRALQKLSVDNLANLTPHPLKVFISYSHPPVTQRIQAIRSAASGFAE